MEQFVDPFSDGEDFSEPPKNVQVTRNKDRF
jgi:hypothetical protein